MSTGVLAGAVGPGLFLQSCCSRSAYVPLRPRNRAQGGGGGAVAWRLSGPSRVEGRSGGFSGPYSGRAAGPAAMSEGAWPGFGRRRCGGPLSGGAHQNCGAAGFPACARPGAARALVVRFVDPSDQVYEERPQSADSKTAYLS